MAGGVPFGELLAREVEGVSEDATLRIYRLVFETTPTPEGDVELVGRQLMYSWKP